MLKKNYNRLISLCIIPYSVLINLKTIAEVLFTLYLSAEINTEYGFEFFFELIGSYCEFLFFLILPFIQLCMCVKKLNVLINNFRE